MAEQNITQVEELEKIGENTTILVNDDNKLKQIKASRMNLGGNDSSSGSGGITRFYMHTESDGRINVRVMYNDESFKTKTSFETFYDALKSSAVMIAIPPVDASDTTGHVSTSMVVAYSPIYDTDKTEVMALKYVVLETNYSDMNVQQECLIWNKTSSN